MTSKKEEIKEKKEEMKEKETKKASREITKEKPKVAKKKSQKERIYATGRRKTAIARVWLSPGEGHITINRKDMDTYWGRLDLKSLILEPIVVTNTQNKYNYFITVKGGGISGQAGAISHAISRVLVQADSALRKTLKINGLLTRDPRKKERKKYGRKRARKGYQYRKR